MNTEKEQNIIACTPVKSRTSTLINNSRSASSPNIKEQINEFIHSTSILRPSSAPSVDVHDNYMALTSKREKKLNHFFGEKTPFDISINEIEVSGLKAILQSKVPLCYFLCSLLEDVCSENLFFFLEALEFEKNKDFNAEEQKESAIYIYETYLSRKSCLEINIDEKVHNDIHKFIQNINSNTSYEEISECFKNARKSVYQLMEGSFAKFHKSSYFEIMKKELGNSPFYKDERMVAVCKLRDYIMKNDNNNKQNPTNQLTKYHEVISILIHQFTKSILDIDFNEKDIFFLHGRGYYS
ncbi:regulator of G protein signaling [Piromyces finnis]|uniref:Regulator of G protein signaling n=1 Tax=Piromyces finnis TaxID=1754191 RepID=A0A1Y1V0Q6_9FUNG|nr:regulator of G protein signaling [Piromyces finnis]|eukprot:ORX44043.1 regulator of G protein signaling [Piromyces finnis]